MRKRILLAAAAATIGIAGPAEAVPTDATLAVTAGALSITAPASAGSLGSIQNSVDGG